MPAVDSPAPDGFEFGELERLLRAFAAAPMTVGLELTIFDPDLDPDGRLARRLVESVAAALT